MYFQLAGRAFVEVLVFDVDFLLEAEIHLLAQGFELFLDGVQDLGCEEGLQVLLAVGIGDGDNAPVLYDLYP